MSTKRENKKINAVGKAGVSLRAIALSAGAILLGIAVLKIASALLPGRGQAMPYLSVAKDILSILGLAVSAFVLQGYLRSYLEVRSKFSLSLAVFVLSISLFMATSSRTIMGVLGIETGYGVFSIVPLIFSVIAVGFLAYASSE